MNLELFNEIIFDVAALNCDQFNNLFQELKSNNDNLEDDHQGEIIDFMTEKLNIVSEIELSELSDYEKVSFLNFLEALY